MFCLVFLFQRIEPRCAHQRVAFVSCIDPPPAVAVRALLSFSSGSSPNPAASLPRCAPRQLLWAALSQRFSNVSREQSP